jgi:hypothetical protein
MHFKNSKCAASRVSRSTKSFQQPFLARIQCFAISKADELDADERQMIRRLSSDDRMQSAWKLLAKIEQESFDVFIEHLLNARAYSANVLPRERNMYKNTLYNIARIRSATRNLRRLSLTATIVADVWDRSRFEALRRELEAEPSFDAKKFQEMVAREHRQRTIAGKQPRVLAILDLIERDLGTYEHKARVEQDDFTQHVSRKASHGESTEFMREVAQTMKSFFQKPYYEIVAAITSVALNLERDVSADAARKADTRRNRTIRSSEKRE